MFIEISMKTSITNYLLVQVTLKKPTALVNDGSRRYTAGGQVVAWFMRSAYGGALGWPTNECDYR
jgi:hypothetical protein